MCVEGGGFDGGLGVWLMWRGRAGGRGRLCFVFTCVDLALAEAAAGVFPTATPQLRLTRISFDFL